VQVSESFIPTTVSGRIGSRDITGTIERGDGETHIRWDQPITLAANESLMVTLR
jgi:hypothetical protein